MPRLSRTGGRLWAIGLACLAATLACARNDLSVDYNAITPVGGPVGGAAISFTPGAALTTAEADPGGAVAAATAVAPGLPARTPRPTQDVAHTPTPDAPHASTLNRQHTESYTVQRADTLNQIGARFGVTAAQIAQANGLTVTDKIFVGQVLLIPLPDQSAFGPALKVLPDSAAVYGPGSADFNIEGFLQKQGGYLAAFSEAVPGALLDGGGPGATLTGAEIVRLTATRYSVSPQLLLAVLEYQSGWVTQPQPDGNTLAYPLRRVEPGREGLLRQLSWAADQLNAGYYGWRAGGLVAFTFDDGNLRVIAPGLNAGTVAVQNFFAQVLTLEGWTRAVAADGFSAVYQRLFGNPFRVAVEPLVPPDLTQPALDLPFEAGKTWAFTGGPHGGWGEGSAWAALDFAPPALAEGCTRSDEWVVASAPGLIVRSEHGAVAEDLDSDGDEGTGWTVFYMHLETRDRVAVGTRVNTGDRLGHPSCEGGVANGTHVHLARKYNGEWISADGALPFILEGWVSAGLGKEYDGTLTKAGVRLEACDCRAAGNEITK